MTTTRTAIASALLLGVVTTTAPRLLASPPDISDAQMEAYLAQYREEMSRIRDREQPRQEQAEARIRDRRAHDERQAAVRGLLARADADAERLSERAEIGPVTLDPTATLDGVSLGMMHDPDPSQPTAGHPNLAEAATNPTAPLIQLQFQNTINFETVGADGVGNTFVVQPVVPYKIGEQQWISRLTFPLLAATADLGDPVGREYGVGDLVTINFATFPIDKGGPWQGTFGVGPALTFPTASSDFLGNGKWQAGPNFIYINTATPGFQWGALVYQQWSFASTGGDEDRPEVSKLFFQPVLTYHFAKNWYVSSSSVLMSIDWNDNARWSIPLGVQLGNVTKFGHQPVKWFVEGFYDVSGNNTGTEWGVKLGLTLLFPSG